MCVGVGGDAQLGLVPRMFENESIAKVQFKKLFGPHMDTNTNHFTLLTLCVWGALSSIHRFCHRDMGYLIKEEERC